MMKNLNLGKLPKMSAPLFESGLVEFCEPHIKKPRCEPA
nr:MAG TPA: hypothetical protein [Caudoviricetes sp.]